MKYIIYVILITGLLCTCTKPDEERINREKQHPIEPEKKIISTDATGNASTEERISDYAQHAFASSSGDDIKDIFTLDITNFNNEEKEVSLENRIYKKDYFQVLVPASMHVIASEFPDSVILKHKEKPAYIYLLSPLWSASSVYLYLDFNYGDSKECSNCFILV